MLQQCKINGCSTPTHNNVFVSVARLAAEQIEPLVREMDEKSQLAPSILQALFDLSLIHI